MKWLPYIEKSIDEEGDSIILTDNEVSERQSLIWYLLCKKWNGYIKIICSFITFYMIQ